MNWKTKVMLVLFCCYSVFWYYFYYKTDDLPDVISLKEYNFNLTTIVRDDSGEIIDKFKVEDRVYIPFDSIPQNVINAVITAEDKNFFRMRLIYGLDVTGIIRAILKNIAAGRIIIGGSTISQQTAKLIWLDNEKTLKRKIKEARIAYRMEKYLPRELIFEIYINLIYFGHNKYGIGSASEFYFNKRLPELTIDEAAMLAGLIQRPYYFSPFINRKVAIKRRNIILARMMNRGFIGYGEYKKLSAKSLVLNIKNTEPIASSLSNFFMNELHRFGYKKVVSQGLDIKTTINFSFQQIAENALKNGIRAYEKRHENRLVLYNIFSEYKLKSLNDFRSKSWDGEPGINSVVDGLITEVYEDSAFAKVGNDKAVITKNSFVKIRYDISDLTKIFRKGDVLALIIIGVTSENNFTVEIIRPEVQGAVVVLEISTGAVKAIVGGKDFKGSQYNRALQTERQAGSAFKPFVYSAYFEKYPDRNLESRILDLPICFKTNNYRKSLWCPKNYEEKSLPAFMGSISIKTAIARSRNVATVYAANDKNVGIGNIVNLARDMGITADLPRYLPTAIGAADVKVIDMANAYSTIFRQGVFKPYWFISAVADRYGKTRELEIREERRVLSVEAADKVLEGMRWVVLAGTARSALKELFFFVAGKTGTTNNFTDAWFIGGSSEYIVAVWIGFDKKAIPLISRESSYKETGGFTALPIFIEIMKEIYRNRIYGDF